MSLYLSLPGGGLSNWPVGPPLGHARAPCPGTMAALRPRATFAPGVQESAPSWAAAFIVKSFQDARRSVRRGPASPLPATRVLAECDKLRSQDGHTARSRAFLFPRRSYSPRPAPLPCPPANRNPPHLPPGSTQDSPRPLSALRSRFPADSSEGLLFPTFKKEIRISYLSFKNLPWIPSYLLRPFYKSSTLVTWPADSPVSSTTRVTNRFVACLPRSEYALWTRCDIAFIVKKPELEIEEEIERELRYQERNFGPWIARDLWRPPMQGHLKLSGCL